MDIWKKDISDREKKKKEVSCQKTTPMWELALEVGHRDKWEGGGCYLLFI
jgi:hypothetical protein